MPSLCPLRTLLCSGAHFEKNGDSLKKERRRDAAAANCSDKADFIASRFTADPSLAGCNWNQRGYVNPKSEITKPITHLFLRSVSLFFDLTALAFK